VYGAITVTATFGNWSMFAGCTASLYLPLILWVAMWPLHKEAYDWDNLFRKKAGQPRPGGKTYVYGDQKDLGVLEWDPVGVESASKKAKIVSAALIAIFLIIIPFSLYGTGYIFSRNLFIGCTALLVSANMGIQSIFGCCVSWSIWKTKGSPDSRIGDSVG
jgi:hypothetical protein